MSKVTRIVRIGLTVADLAGARAFYTQGLGFRSVEAFRREGPAFADLTSLPGVSAEVAVLRLGNQEIELACFDPPGRAYPSARAANDPWFQHFAVVVADMDRAYAAVAAQTSEAISRGGPQLLPPSTGSVTAYKFRDPGGHPLELSHIPGGVWADPADAPAPGAVFLGVDHSAIAVADLEASLAFYTEVLGLRIGGRVTNSGPTQARLDGLDGAVVDIVALEPESAPTPHIELLAYRSPAPHSKQISIRPNDVAATRLVLETDDLADMGRRLRQTETRFISVDTQARLAGVLVRDPDGHILELIQGS